MQALKDLPSLEKLEYEQDEYGVTYGRFVVFLCNCLREHTACAPLTVTMCNLREPSRRRFISDSILP
jgi:hypothetical protein